jgi:hypothetical protein
MMKPHGHVEVMLLNFFILNKCREMIAQVDVGK